LVLEAMVEARSSIDGGGDEAIFGFRQGFA